MGVKKLGDVSFFFAYGDHAPTATMFDCRTCHGTFPRDQVLAPCRCSGGLQWICRACLTQLRTEGPVEWEDRCPTCAFAYIVLDPSCTKRLRLFGQAMHATLADRARLVCRWGPAFALLILIFWHLYAKPILIAEMETNHTIPIEFEGQLDGTWRAWWTETNQCRELYRCQGDRYMKNKCWDPNCEGLIFCCTHVGWQRIFHVRVVVLASRLDFPLGIRVAAALFHTITFDSHMYLTWKCLAILCIASPILLLQKITVNTYLWMALWSPLASAAIYLVATVRQINREYKSLLLDLRANTLPLDWNRRGNFNFRLESMFT
jgi:hypothetical protein